jgi:hypothetical protein
MGRSMLRFLVFLGIWIIGNAIADFVLHLGASPWRMAFGYFVGTVGFVIADWIKE